MPSFCIVLNVSNVTFMSEEGMVFNVVLKCMDWQNIEVASTFL
jgi:hypothetical protein